VLPRELKIDLRRLEPDVYQVLAVQDFWVEDCNPNLHEYVAAIFLARRTTEGRWEEPENWPVECRTLSLLGYLDTRGEGHRVKDIGAASLLAVEPPC